MTDISLRRYTNLAATIHLLSTKKITLLNPATWDDRNDAYFMAEYKRLKSLQTVLALCFAEQSETYHHWRVFSSGADGVCIEFDKERLAETFIADPRIRQNVVDYRTISDFSAIGKFPADDLPFLKRYPYTDEAEYRVLLSDPVARLDFADFDISLSWIRRITLSPWLPRALEKSVKAVLKSIDGCSRVKIYRSTLIENERWKAMTWPRRVKCRAPPPPRAGKASQHADF